MNISNNKHLSWLALSITAISLMASLAGMLDVTRSFRFFSDEQHLFEDSLWLAGEEEIKTNANVDSLYSGYYEQHYPERGAHPNGIVLLLGGYIWFLKFFKDLVPSNITFFVMAIRILLIGAVLMSLYFLYLLHKEMDEIYGKWTGIIAVAIAALFPPLVAYGSIRAMDTMSLLFLMICLWSFVRLVKSERPSIFNWVIPGIAAGLFIILKKSGVLIIPIIVIYGLIFLPKGGLKKSGKKLIFSVVLSLVILVVTNNPYLYFMELVSPSPEFQNASQNIFASYGMKKFGFFGFQVAKLWELFHPDYYYYLGYHRHGGPNIQFLGLINKLFTVPFLILWTVSIIPLLALKKWKAVILLNAPLVILVLSLPNFAAYRLLPVIPLFLSTPAVAYISIFNRYRGIKPRLFLTLGVLLIILALPLYSIWRVPVIDGETYLDLGEVAASNRHFRFGRGAFFDRELIKWKADRIDSPFALILLQDGLLKTGLSFKKGGEYRIDFLLASGGNQAESAVELRVKLADRTEGSNIIPNSIRWYSAGPFKIDADDLRKELLIRFNGLHSGASGLSTRIDLYDIRILESAQKQSEVSRGYIPMPWWLKYRINKS